MSLTSSHGLTGISPRHRCTVRHRQERIGRAGAVTISIALATIVLTISAAGVGSPALAVGSSTSTILVASEHGEDSAAGQDELVSVGILPFRNESGDDVPDALRLEMAQELHRKFVVGYPDILPRLVQAEPGEPLAADPDVDYLVRGGLLAVVAGPESGTVTIHLYAELLSADGSRLDDFRVQGTAPGAPADLSRFAQIDEGTGGTGAANLAEAFAASMATLAQWVYTAIAEVGSGAAILEDPQVAVPEQVPATAEAPYEATADRSPYEGDNWDDPGLADGPRGTGEDSGYWTGSGAEPISSELVQLMEWADALVRDGYVADEDLAQLDTALTSLAMAMERRKGLIRAGTNTSEIDETIAGWTEALRAVVEDIEEDRRYTQAESDIYSDSQAASGNYSGAQGQTGYADGRDAYSGEGAAEDRWVDPPRSSGDPDASRDLAAEQEGNPVETAADYIRGAIEIVRALQQGREEVAELIDEESGAGDSREAEENRANVESEAAAVAPSGRAGGISDTGNDAREGTDSEEGNAFGWIWGYVQRGTEDSGALLVSDTEAGLQANVGQDGYYELEVPAERLVRVEVIDPFRLETLDSAEVELDAGEEVQKDFDLAPLSPEENVFAEESSPSPSESEFPSSQGDPSRNVLDQVPAEEGQEVHQEEAWAIIDTAESLEWRFADLWYEIQEAFPESGQAVQRLIGRIDEAIFTARDVLNRAEHSVETGGDLSTLQRELEAANQVWREIDAEVEQLVGGKERAKALLGGAQALIGQANPIQGHPKAQRMGLAAVAANIVKKAQSLTQDGGRFLGTGDTLAALEEAHRELTRLWEELNQLRARCGC